VRIVGDVPPSAVRTVVEELRISAGFDDTTMFSEVREFDVDRAGRIWAFDAGGWQVLLYGPDGTLLRRIGRRGAGPGEFNANGGMVVWRDSGLAQWDPENARVSFFAPSGDFESSWRTPAGFYTSRRSRSESQRPNSSRRPCGHPARKASAPITGWRLLSDSGGRACGRCSSRTGASSSASPFHLAVP
jgi:hypothetical protein